MIVKRVAIPRIGGILEQRAARMESDLEQAEELSRQAGQLKEESREKLAGAIADAEELRANAREEIRQMTDAAMEEASQKIAGMTEVAEARIDEIRRNAHDGIIEIAEDAAYEIVALMLPGKEDRTVASEAVRTHAGSNLQ